MEAATFFEKCAALLGGGNGGAAASGSPAVEAQRAASEESSVSTQTTQVIAYLAELLSRQVISDPELARLIEGLEEGRIINPITEEDADLSSAKLIHREGLEGLFREARLDFGKLREWAMAALKDKAIVRIKRADVQKKTETIHQKADFGLIKKATFQMGEGDKTVAVELSAYELMSHFFTQYQWSVLMGSNPSRFVDGPHTITKTIDGKAIKMQPDNPVETVSPDEVFTALKKLNELAELADKGDQTSQKKIQAIMADYKPGDRYDLPTEAQLAYILNKRGDLSETDLQKYVYYSANAGGTTHPVGELAPLIIDGISIYDPGGQLWMITKDWWADKLPTGKKLKDPKGPASHPNNYRVALGGSWYSSAGNLRPAYRGSVSPDGPYGSVGFRLVRQCRP